MEMGTVAGSPGLEEARVYLDHAATTPVSSSARRAWLETTEALALCPGNPGSLHFGGRTARALLEDARERLGGALGAERTEVVFTSGATESAALAIGGSLRANHRADQPVAWLTSGLEHPAVLEQSEVASTLGVISLRLPTRPSGRAVVGLDTVAELTAGFYLAAGSLTLVCSETGVVQPVSEFVSSLRSVAPQAVIHSDATQAVGNVPVSFAELDLDLMTIGGHKFGAPVGTGALLARRSVALAGDRPGGGQERGIRSGTPDVAGAVALSVAAEEACSALVARDAHLRALRQRLVTGLPREVTLTTDAQTVPSIIHLSLPTGHPEVLLLEMDRQGIAVSAGSACHAGVTRPSPVLLEMGRSQAQALGVLRVSMGEQTEGAHVDRFLAALPHALEQARRMDHYDGQAWAEDATQ